MHVVERSCQCIVIGEDMRCARNALWDAPRGERRYSFWGSSMNGAGKFWYLDGAFFSLPTFIHKSFFFVLLAASIAAIWLFKDLGLTRFLIVPLIALYIYMLSGVLLVGVVRKVFQWLIPDVTSGIIFWKKHLQSEIKASDEAV